MIAYILGIATGLLLPFFYGGWLFLKESRKAKDKHD